VQIPDAGDTMTEEFAAFYALDRNKRSIVVDLKKDRGREVFLRLVEKADVLIEGFRPGVMDRLGVGYSRLSELNPRLVYCALTGYGQTGPYAALPGHDMNYVAIAGALSMIGPRGGAPCFPSNYLADLAGAGLHGTIAVLLALAAREKTGRGQYVDLAYLDGVMSLLTMEAKSYFMTGKVPRRGETAPTGGYPLAQALKCSDGKYFTVACFEHRFWVNLCKAIGREDLTAYDLPRDPEQRDWAIAELQKVFLTKTRDEWWEFLKPLNTCVAPVLDYDEACDNEQVRARDMVMEFDHPEFGNIRQIGIVAKMSDTPGSVRSLGIPAGASTNEVLSWLGYGTDDIAGLRGDAAGA
jgi:crotonobetainyl-CoA:carnitine CoA-transferase CaiB-like acyl-CoA transferase